LKTITPTAAGDDPNNARQTIVPAEHGISPVCADVRLKKRV